MAAELPAIRTYLRMEMRVGGPNLAENPRTQGFLDNGLDAWSQFSEFDDKAVEDLVKYLRRPGGDEEGVPIPAAAIQRIQTACFAARYYEMIGREVDARSMAWSRIKGFRDLITINDEYNEPDPIKPPSKNSKIVEWTETLEEYLRGVRGIRKIPLSYLIRDEVEPGPISAYPNGYNFPYAPEYSSFQEELISRATHTHPTYATDNEMLYHLVSTALADTPFMTSIKRHRHGKNGRGAYQDLVTHHSGTTKWNDLASESDRKSTTTVWNGRSHRYTLTIHINNLRSFHNDLLRASDHIAYAIPTKTQRVERLLKSIQTNDPTILAGMTTVKASADPDTGLYSDFERAADFILRVAPKNKQSSKDHNISSVQQDFDDIDKVVSKGPKTGVELRYHTRKEFMKLNQEEKEELLALRKNGKDNNPQQQGSKRKSNKAKNQSKRVKKYVKKLEARIAALESSTNEEPLNGQVNEQGGTRRNQALERPTQRQN